MFFFRFWPKKTVSLKRNCRHACVPMAIRLLRCCVFSNRRDFIQRERCSADGRARRVHLTELGIQLQRKLIASVKPLHDLMDEALVGRNCEQFFECLDEIAKAMADPAKSVVDRTYKKRNTDSQLTNTSR